MKFSADMFRKPVWWFGTTCAGLALLLAAEWLPGAEPAPESFAPVTHRAAVAAAPAASEADGADDRDVDSWAETVLARPLFAVGRRPPKHQDSGGAIASAGMPRLSGIIITRHSRRAIFMPAGGKPLVLAEGASLDDATIRRITIGGVYVSGPKGDQVLVPSFDGNRVPPPPVIPTAAPFQPGGPNAFRPIFPNVVQPQVVPPGENANDDDDNNDDASQPTPPPRPPMPPMPGGFRNPMFPRGRPQ